jgi:hypothetical protein
VSTAFPGIGKFDDLSCVVLRHAAFLKNVSYFPLGANRF